ncbi:hypothetical protein Scep_016308 [Stephania cephalantha]|uniref:TF-B3 domain-containing protein n=1 Tax=Stephania cephalantha TaxID=152367 RepID=A0AAP0IN91_9MAGN
MGANMTKEAKELDEPKDHLYARVLTQDCSESLAIPTKCVKDVIPKLPSLVPLVLSTGKIWNVGVKEEGDSLVTKYGWKEFVEDNSLKENDVLLFKFHNYGQVCFHVSLFDRTGWEKVQSLPCDNIRELQKNKDHVKVDELDSEVETNDVMNKETQSPLAQEEKEIESNRARVIGPDPVKLDSPPSQAMSKKINCSSKLSTKKRKEAMDSLGDDANEPANKKLTTPASKTFATSDKDVHSTKKLKDSLGDDVHELANIKLTTPALKTSATNDKDVLSTKRLKDSLGDDVHGLANIKLTTPASKTSATNDKGVQDVHDPSNEQLITIPSSKISAKKSTGQRAKRKYERKKPVSSSKSKKKPVQREGRGSSPSGSYRLYFKSHRRPVTEEEKKKAFQSAAEVISYKPNFVTTMVPTHVEKKFFLTIPRKLVLEHVPHQTKAAILRVPPNPKTWIVRLTGNVSRFIGLDGGWADFVMDNNLEVGDACLFELCGVQEGGEILVDVSIHRVVQEVVPLEKVRPAFDSPKANPISNKITLSS